MCVGRGEGAEQKQVSTRAEYALAEDAVSAASWRDVTDVLLQCVCKNNRAISHLDITCIQFTTTITNQFD